MDLEFYIENCIIPQYASFDDAHNIEHISRVIEVSLLLAEEYGVNPIMCYTIAAYHDIGLPQGRETHHLTSAQILREDKALRNWCSAPYPHRFRRTSGGGSCTRQACFGSPR